jgi:uncharacterized protein (TIGR02466 family)
MSSLSLFPSTVYKASLTSAASTKKLNRELLREVENLSQEDSAGIEWSAKNYSNGYTSYASVNQLHKFSPTFTELETHIRKHVLKFIDSLKLDYSKQNLQMNTCWANVMEEDGHHSMHIHPHSIVSGTYYLKMPKNSSALRFEDPRYGHFMSRPPVKANAPAKMQTHFTLAAEAGELILFESWLKHEVPRNKSESPRISISFNY